MGYGVRFVVSGGDALRTTLVARLNALGDLRPVLALSGAIVRDASKMRIRNEGANLDPPWIPSKKPTGKTGYDTGNMANSIEYEVRSENAVRIGTNVPYARYFQFGTGVFAGHRPWTIRPVNRKVLSWVFGGQRFFAREVTINGQPPRPFLLFEERDITAIITEWRKHLGGDGPQTVGAIV